MMRIMKRMGMVVSNKESMNENDKSMKPYDWEWEIKSLCKSSHESIREWESLYERICKRMMKRDKLPLFLFFFFSVYKYIKRHTRERKWLKKNTHTLDHKTWKTASTLNSYIFKTCGWRWSRSWGSMRHLGWSGLLFI